MFRRELDALETMGEGRSVRRRRPAPAEEELRILYTPTTRPVTPYNYSLIVINLIPGVDRNLPAVIAVHGMGPIALRRFMLDFV